MWPRLLVLVVALVTAGCADSGTDILAPSRANPVDRRTDWAQQPIVCWYCEHPTFYSYTDAAGVTRLVTVCQDWQPRPPTHCDAGDSVTRYTPKP